MPLTPLEKQAGRALRDAAQAALDALNEQDPPGQYVLALWRVVRHECQDAGGASIGIALREVREHSPEYRRLSVVRKEGKCSGCGLSVRSRTVRFAVATDHPSRE